MDALRALLASIPWLEKEIDLDALSEVVIDKADELLKAMMRLVPLAEQFALDVLDAMFAPRQILRQIALILAIQTTLLSFNSAREALDKLLSLWTERGRRERALQDTMQSASSYEDWRAAAARLDELRGHSAWRHEEDSVLFDCRMVKKRIASTMHMLERGDVFDLMFRLRGGLSRDQFGLQHPGLFTRALAGTKVVIERYHETMARALNFVCDSPIADEEIPLDAKLAFFNETRHSYGRTALLLSGGAYLGYYHLGVVKALFEQSVLPRVISGASAGSIMTAIVGTHTNEELRDLLRYTPDNQLPQGMRTDFFRITYELQSKIARRLNYLVPQVVRPYTSALFSWIFDRKLLNMDTEHFKKTMMHDVGLWTFQEAFDRTGRIINITVAPINSYDPPRLLNYLTAPHVCVWSAAAASCALPGVFEPVCLIVKEPNGQFRPENEWTRRSLLDREEAKAAKLSSYSDGSIESDLPMQQLSELFNVNHFIVSQVNPHSSLLSSFALRATVWSSPLYGAVVGYVRFLTAQCRDWLKNVVNFLIFRSQAPVWSSRRGMIQLLTQEYEGRDNDITIMPWNGHISPVSALLMAIKNPTNDEFYCVIHAAEKNTWPAIARIRAHCLIETTLDQCVQKMRRHIVEESERQEETFVKVLQGTEAKPFVRDRTPSFHTTRSILNFSGLSSTDPSPLQQTIHKSSSKRSDLGAEESDRSSDDALTVSVPVGDVPLPTTSSLSTLSRTMSASNDSIGADSGTPSDMSIHKTTRMADFYYRKSQSSDNLLVTK